MLFVIKAIIYICKSVVHLICFCLLEKYEIHELKNIRNSTFKKPSTTTIGANEIKGINNSENSSVFLIMIDCCLMSNKRKYTYIHDDNNISQKLLKQGYVTPRLKSSLQQFHGHNHNLIDRYEISMSQMTMDLLLFT